MTILLKENDIIFISHENGVSERKPAQKTGRLCVSYSNKYDRDTFKIYGILSHMPFIPFRIRSPHEAVELAQWFEKEYGDYLDLWEADETMNIVFVARYSVPKGVQIHKTVEKLDGHDIITKRQFFRVMREEDVIPNVHTQQNIPSKGDNVGFIQNIITSIFNFKLE